MGAGPEALELAEYPFFLAAAFQAQTGRSQRGDPRCAPSRAATPCWPFHHPPADRGLLPAASPDGSPADTARKLTAREIEVVNLVAKGLSNAEIAERLYPGDAIVKATSPASWPGSHYATGSRSSSSPTKPASRDPAPT
jgi:hypothetical protein